MLHKSSLKDLLSKGDLGPKEKLLICLAVDGNTAKPVKEIKTLAFENGLRSAKDWNVSSLLSRTAGKAARVADGWILTKAGKEYITSIGVAPASIVASQVSSSLRSHASTLSNTQTKAFIEESVSCFESHLFRAAVVLSWIGAISLLYDHVITNRTADFNSEATRRFPKFRPVATNDDLARIKESEFLDILEGISVIGKSVRKELGVCLDLRNGCGHPNSLRIAESRVAAHIESLMLNVYSKFG